MPEFDLVLKNGKIFHQGHFIEASLGIANGKIAKISKQPLTGNQFINCKGNSVLPGLIDLHVHFRMPGYEHKEDWKTGSSAALAGGVTTVFDMPNTNPATITRKLFEEKQALIQGKSYAHYGLHFGLTAEHFSDFAHVPCSSGKLFAGSSTGNLLVADYLTQERILRTAPVLNKRVFVHAEDETEIQKNITRYKNDPVTSDLHSKIRTVNAEVRSIESLLSLQEKTRARVHICHVSTAPALDLIANFKQKNSNNKVTAQDLISKKNSRLTCEITPHHLFLSDTSYARLGNLVKVNPSLKSKSDVAALWLGLQSNLIDVIATDHAPHTLDEKSQDYWSAPSGMPGLETMLPLLLTAVHDGKISLEKVVQLCCENPAKLMDLHSKGVIVEGNDADLVIIDPRQKWKVKNDDLFTKCKWSAFEGWPMHGKVIHTLVNGTISFSENQMIGKPLGKECVSSNPN